MASCMPSRYRLYLDESGDHSGSHPDEIGKRYLGIVGVAIRQDEYPAFQGRVEQFKRDHLLYDNDDPPILHREDIVYKRGPYRVLLESERRSRFDKGLIALINATNFMVIAVVIDKTEHGKKLYRRVTHPYHYCLVAMLERYCGWLGLYGYEGDVLAESRGGKEDRELKVTYERLYNCGGYYLDKSLIQKTLTSKQLKLKPKRSNVAGLQLADLLAHPISRDVLFAYKRIENRGSKFADEISKIILPKYNKQVYQGRIKGYGQVILA